MDSGNVPYTSATDFRVELLVMIKMRIGFDALPIINPYISISATESCDGEECVRSFIDGEGNLVSLPGHLHIHLRDPKGGSRTFGVAACDDDEWQLPREVYGQFD